MEITIQTSKIILKGRDIINAIKDSNDKELLELKYLLRKILDKSDIRKKERKKYTHTRKWVDKHIKMLEAPVDSEITDVIFEEPPIINSTSMFVEKPNTDSTNNNHTPGHVTGKSYRNAEDSPFN